MDITIPIKDVLLNVRVVVLVKTKNGYALEKSKHPSGFLYFIGGRVKIGESSEDAAKREIEEEIGAKIDRLSFRTVVENFFTEDGKKFHEINFVYEADEDLEIHNMGIVDLVEIPVADFSKTDIRPRALRDYISSGDHNPHIICSGI